MSSLPFHRHSQGDEDIATPDHLKVEVRAAMPPTFWRGRFSVGGPGFPECMLGPCR